MYWVGPESKKSNFHQLFNSGGASSKTGAGGHLVLVLGIKLLPVTGRVVAVVVALDKGPLLCICY